MADSIDPFLDQHILYDTEYDAIIDMVGHGEEAPPDWPAVAIRVDQALSDPALPRWYRAEYQLIRAMYAHDPESHLNHARASVADMVQVLRDDEKSAEEIDERLAPLRDLLTIIEGALQEKETSKERTETTSNENNVAGKPAQTGPATTSAAAVRPEEDHGELVMVDEEELKQDEQSDGAAMPMDGDKGAD
ncbi:unnamed protein product [Zymoseptoria tritici ST99CH_1A5]|uniref:Uncharacterized protein n=3 Tax=Zymoseptoria tritici TaxID=1047171 RepID=F9X700_ZYMTI|nr:uncharacterized protein MYCGRDRAFT_91862 [Zymoseptoria tritici IPO323]EGP88908.1 hypothetical protein MYCGRDRAFT_91862 [Zymoseptoria tritici IPO323]SMQ49031.1 unnamed protein product [Zymoseptoria tritici ST99CH_3D7]SMR50031.1 unnamed protein product [Zymoseptoria tritici ST99CH_3D1]SMY22730.1 unnamed protein product [Zymoseptoria tritici ST99CH_1A5]